MHKTFLQTKLSKLFCHQVKLLTIYLLYLSIYSEHSKTIWLRSSLSSEPHIWWLERGWRRCTSCTGPDTWAAVTWVRVGIVDIVRYS